jgi:RNA polymerase sigma-70 factor (ECF subfamily)
MRRIARAHVSSDAATDEVVQDTWAAAVSGLDRFEERSSLRTWLFQILINRAKTQGMRDRRTLPFSALDAQDEGPVVAPDRFLGPDSPRSGAWSSPPRPWECPESRLLSIEARKRLRAALASLPARQQLVVAMRDVEGMGAEEVCRLLEISSENQRVLLHRGRSALRGALESYVQAD